ncbi:MAG: glycosyltransferase family 4 protein [bacterium]
MRILSLVTDGFGGQGGIALHCRHLLGALCSCEHVEVVHALPRVKPLYYEPLPEKLRYLDQSADTPYSYTLAVAKETTSQGRWDIVFCEHINLLWLAAAVATLHKAKLILVIHGFESWTAPQNLQRWSLDRVDRVISVSNVTKDRFLSWSKFASCKISVIQNAVELAQFAPGPRPDYLLQRYQISDEPVIMTLGRLSEKEQSKGFDLVISILPQLLKTNPGLRYLIIGEGKDRQRLEQLCHSVKVSEQVTFCGEITNAEKADHYRLADAYIMPSRLEGFGYVFLEALACGLPVVGSLIDGSRDALLNGTLGELIDPDKPQSLYDAVLRALSKPKVVPPQLNQFSIERFNREIQGFLGELITDGS